jgi:hypothetical protein
LSIAAGAIEPDSPSVVSEQISAKFLEIEEKHETTLCSTSTGPTSMRFSLRCLAAA